MRTGDKEADTEGQANPMAVRKRFNAEEKAAIAAGGAVEVQNVTQWHAATLREPALIRTDGYGWQHVVAVIDRTRGTVRAGDVWHATPGHLRAVTRP